MLPDTGKERVSLSYQRHCLLCRSAATSATAAPQKAGIAKSFSIQPQGGKFKLSASAGKGFAAALSPAYVKVPDVFLEPHFPHVSAGSGQVVLTPHR